MTTHGPSETAQRIASDIERVSSVAAVARAAGLKRTTLADHLRNPERLTLGEVYAVADALRAHPSEYFKDAEHRSSAA
ncbi:helix-turn-helix domain-containing protein [Brachybacterium muris]|uniref:helix-turn-helix domain-containing protein n=1 Tax=Brachybacterium muris TaxID=219301 RepID=UPI00223B9749|nr:helix-turn-helix domain-containing protein [Brachybacterium muris]MCT2177461.1 helix-turn-helix domain-containing protein [Brachybacterium muris]